jgi:MATE family multidrug resistance protein
MLHSFRNLRQEFRPMFRLALPVVLAELGWMTMGIVDTLMVGPISPAAIGAVGMGTSLFMGVCIFAMGLMLGLDTLVSQAFGAGRLDECHRWLVHGVVMSLVLSAPITLVILGLASSMTRWGLHPEVLHLTQPYLMTLAWSVPPLLLYASFRRYLQGVGVARPVMLALAAANLVNVFFNWVLIYGHLGAPALGVRGSAWATVLARIGMSAFLLLTIVVREHNRRPGLFETSMRIEMRRIRRLIALGLPASAQVTLEIGVFAAATALAGKLVPASLAAHQIALNLVAFTFMVPLGVSAAGAVRVGHAVGRGDPEGAARAGWTAILFGMLFMTCSAMVFLLVPRLLIGAFSPDSDVRHVGVSLLFVGAVFQIFDGLQAVATGVLRGLGDTRSPMFWNLGGHWFIGLPLGYWLCFGAGTGVVGLWWGLSTGLTICGIGLLVVWSRRIQALAVAPALVFPGRPGS